MRRRIIVFCVTVLCALRLCSCGQGREDGVLIIPSSRGDDGTATAVSVTAAAVTEQIITPQTEPVTVETAQPEPDEPAEETTFSEPSADPDGMLAQAEALIGDAEFRTLLAQYGADTESSALVGAVAAMLAYQNLHTADAGIPVPPTDDAEGTVYWTSGGSVWHVTADCSALAKSKSVNSGTEAQAAAAGKSRACKRCGS
ncbi:MAG: hypothetical protein E7604_14000 [Ruminococcaceae bacterium]|nr:hypothetical protein [Oscillospiraceae bacterium]